MKFSASSQYKTFGPESMSGAKNHGWLSDVGDTLGWVSVECDKPVGSITIESGFHEYPDREDWGWHARPRKISIDGAQYKLEDTHSPQTIVFDQPKQKITIKIEDVYPGSKFNVLGIKRIT